MSTHILLSILILCGFQNVQSDIQEHTVEDRCTTIIVGKDAGIDGPMVSHTVSYLSASKILSNHFLLG